MSCQVFVFGVFIAAMYYQPQWTEVYLWMCWGWLSDPQIFNSLWKWSKGNTTCRTSEYGLFSLWCNWLCQIHVLFVSKLRTFSNSVASSWQIYRHYYWGSAPLNVSVTMNQLNQIKGPFWLFQTRAFLQKRSFDNWRHTQGRTLIKASDRNQLA